MPSPQLQLGTKVVVRLYRGEAPALGTIIDGPDIMAGVPVFKVETEGVELWHPAEHLQPYLRLVSE